MTSCPITVDDQFRCPTKWDLWRQIMALLPRGRAWQTHEVGTERTIANDVAQFGAYELGSTGLGTEPTVDRLTVLQQYWASYAEVLEYLHQRACALLEEFFCATTDEMGNEWGAEYGFPDPCEPWATLCDKVRAQGGSTCVYLASLASRLGYAIECADCGIKAQATADCAIADCVSLDCDCEPNVIRIRIVAADSPAWVNSPPFNADAAAADCTPPCPTPPEAVICLIERFKPAHVKAYYEVIL